ncbi:hypothetical protein C8J32_105253 [Rhizobium sp. PP-CC-3A-592]|nr:hypothetical protein C8J32_105253 [Rhizobium sp. PP-CC-3A-592]
MSELAFAARHLSTTPKGLNTVFHFRDENGKTLALLLDGDVGRDFVDHCRIYYEPEPDPVSAEEMQIDLAVIELFDIDAASADESDPRQIADALDRELRILLAAADGAN